MDTQNIVKGGLAAVLTAVSIYFGNVALPIIVLLVCMTLDWISGVWSAFLRGEWSSKVGLRGIIKKFGYMLLVAVSAVIDWVIVSAGASFGVEIPTSLCFCLLVSIWLILNECISILENISKAGVPLPKWLVSMVKRLKGVTDETAENIVGGKKDENS